MSINRARVGILVVFVFVVLAAAIELSAHRVIGVNHPTGIGRGLKEFWFEKR